MLEKVLRGSIAGLLGGLVFGLWMADKGALPMIAGLVGGSSGVLGFGVHLLISTVIGGTFGYYFDRLIEGPLSGILWGMVYGFLWWFLGPLTLMPIGLGMAPQWTASAVAATIPSLLWHVVFGGVTAIAYLALAGEGGRRLVSAKA
ncbi:MAG: hypothetical protein ACE5JS_08685 [Nitrospinota bacterium]